MTLSWSHGTVMVGSDRARKVLCGLASATSLGATRGIRQWGFAANPKAKPCLHTLVFSTFSPPCPATVTITPARGEPCISQGSQHPDSLPAPASQEPAQGCREPAGEAVGPNLQHGNLFIYRHPDKREPIHQASGTSRPNEILLLSPYLQRGGPLPQHACVKEGL